MSKITISIQCDNVVDAQKILASLETKTETPAPKAQKAPAKKAAVVEDEDEMSFDDAATEDAEEILDEDVIEDEIVEEKPKAKKAAAPKLTEKDVNAAAMKHAKKYGRTETEGILKKFKVKSILELKADQYAAVIKALAV